MKLSHFTIENYRSITTKSEITFGDFTVLVGRNNEGKTNVLRALDLALGCVGEKSLFSPSPLVRMSAHHELGYDWLRDYPVQLQETCPDGGSHFELVFALEPEELQQGPLVDASQFVKLSILFLNRSCTAELSSGSTHFTKARAREISSFLRRLLSNVYIPAVRTDQTAREALERTIAQRLRVLERNPEYVQALGLVKELENKELEQISKQLIEPLKLFLPGVEDVHIVPYGYRYPFDGYGRAYDVRVNDGVETSIDQKGEGIQSLLSLAILRGSAKSGSSTVLIVEEPESHLHPGAMRELEKVLQQIATGQSQVIISTHNPVFVKRDEVSSNYIVGEGEIHPARSISDIRETLGVSVSDNLTNAERVIVVEGMGDRKVLERLFAHRYLEIKDILHDGRLAVVAVRGMNNLAYELTRLQSELCDFIVLYDDDQAGRDAINEAEQKQLFADKTTQAVPVTRVDCKSSELEDFISPNLYVPIVCEYFKLAYDDSNEGKENRGMLVNGRHKWSDRVKRVCQARSVACGEDDLKEVKTQVIVKACSEDMSVEEAFAARLPFVERLAWLLTRE